MSIRRKIIISLCLIIVIIASLLSINSIMARREAGYVKKLLWIHHQYTALLNLKIHIGRQLSEAQDIFIYGKKADVSNFQKSSQLVQNEGRRLSKALMEEDALTDKHKTAADDHVGTAVEVSDNQRRLVQLQHNYEDLQRQLILMASLLKIGRKAKAQEHFKNVISQQFNDFFTDIDEWITVKRRELKDTEASFVKLNRRNNYSSIIALGSILVIVVIFAAALIYMLSVRMRELLEATKKIADGDLLFTVAERGNDELTQFARAMNLMTSGLANSRKKLLEQSYYSGMADMVAGTLHNIRNSLSPVVVNLEMITDKLEAVRTDRLTQAMAEIIDKDIADERRFDLLEFMALSVEKLDKSVPDILENITGINKKITVISRILDNNSHYSLSERPLEKIILSDIIQDALGMVSEKYLAAAAVQVDPGIVAIAPFMTQRIVLVQIIANLVNNAIESIMRRGADNGTVKIEAEDCRLAKGQELRIRIIDNGTGIPIDMQETIFQRGVSTKKSSSGLGLHWCANAASSLNGRLTVENTGTGRDGACFRLAIVRNQETRDRNQETGTM